METPKIVSDKVVLQEARYNAGPRIGRVQVIEYKGVQTTVNFWYDNNGNLLFVK